MKKNKIDKRLQRKRRVRARVKGSEERPRLSVFRSNRHIFAQIIDDVRERTLVSMSDLEIKKTDKKKDDHDKKTKKNLAKLVGEELAKKALSKKIKSVVFDKSGYKYHGRVKEVASGARKGGLEF
jgi:large subunit ribosomal protein L18